MNVQANGHEGSRQQIRQKILCDINSVWRFVETLEKQCREMLGETDPMAESLGFAATHMMNASCEIEEHVAECVLVQRELDFRVVCDTPPRTEESLCERSVTITPPKRRY